VELAGLHWEKEKSGTTFNGLPVATDTVSQTKYIGELVGAQINPNPVINRKTADERLVSLDVQPSILSAIGNTQ
jgi:hypothetical protein